LGTDRLATAYNMEGRAMTEERKRDYDWHRHYYKGRIGLAVLLEDELAQVAETIGRMRPRLTRVVLARTGDDLPNEWPQHLDKHELLPPLPEDLNEWEKPTQAIARGYERLAAMAAEFDDVDWWVFLLGDTVLLHEYGIESIIAATEAVEADAAVAQALGQEFHAADLTEEDLKDGKTGGRLQEEGTLDFLPHLFVVRHGVVKIGMLSAIPLANRWNIEECLGKTLEAAQLYVFSSEAFGFTDGVVYNARY